MTKTLGLVGLLAMAACGEDPPSCQQAVGHYYGAGCQLVNLQTGQPFSEAEIVVSCKQSLAMASSSCEGAFEDLLVCFNTVKSPASTNADCDCTAEQDATLTCD